MKNKTLLLILVAFIGFATKVIAQKVPPKSKISNLKIVNDTINHKVDVEFMADKEISNLLVIITDSLGHTIFLDNQYRFKGNYKHSMDFKKKGKGKYSLKIIKDEEPNHEQVIINK